MRTVAAEDAGRLYDLFTQLTKDCPPLTPWSAVRAKYPGKYDRARTEYRTQPAAKALDADPDHMFTGRNLVDFLVRREQYVQAARDQVVSTFAFIKDGKWFERGRMGSWAMGSNEKPGAEWVAQFNQMLDSLPDSTFLTVVDCHLTLTYTEQYVTWREAVYDSPLIVIYGYADKSLQIR